MQSEAHHALQLPEPQGARMGLFRRLRMRPPHVRLNDPAERAVHDFMREPPWIIGASQRIDEVRDQMFQLGARAFLVTQAQCVLGLITSDDINDRLAGRQSDPVIVADVMTAASDIPAIDWQTVLDARVRDLLEIFEGARVSHLVVLESISSASTRVRGLIQRSRLDRQLRYLHA